jgi:hypothetical protein
MHSLALLQILLMLIAPTRAFISSLSAGRLPRRLLAGGRLLSSPDGTSQDDRWAAMYSSSSAAPQQTFADGGSLAPSSFGPVRVVTFDLDDTLWDTAAVIRHANEVLQQHLAGELPGAQLPPIYLLMKGLFAQFPAEYHDASLVPAGSEQAEPVYLTKLRKDALAVVHSLHAAGESLDPYERRKRRERASGRAGERASGRAGERASGRAKRADGTRLHATIVALANRPVRAWPALVYTHCHSAREASGWYSTTRHNCCSRNSSRTSVASARLHTLPFRS